MCSQSKCDKCGKTSYQGCGNHLEKIFEKVKTEDLCLCKNKIKEYIENKRK